MNTERKVQWSDGSRARLRWLADSLVLLFVCKNAAWSIVQQRYGDEGFDGLVTAAWYALAVGCLLRASLPRPDRLAGVLGHRAWMAVAALVCASASAAGFAFGGFDHPVIHPLDWLVLALAFAVPAGLAIQC